MTGVRATLWCPRCKIEREAHVQLPEDVADALMIGLAVVMDDRDVLYNSVSTPAGFVYNRQDRLQLDRLDEAAAQIRAVLAKYRATVPNTIRGTDETSTPRLFETSP